MTRFGKSGHHRDWYLRLTSKEDRTKPEVESPDEEWVSRPWTGIDGEVAWQTPDGKLHRIGAPAALRHDGTEEWWERGERHRVGGPATSRVYLVTRALLISTRHQNGDSVETCGKK